jgi:O-antigen ligase
MLNTWVISHSVIAFAVLIYLSSAFGSQIVTSTNRGPFQVAMQSLIPTWPNYFGVALAIAICIVYGRLLVGSRGRFLKVQLVVLAAGLVITFSRGSYLACVAGVTAITIVSGLHRRAILLFSSAIILAVSAGLLVPAVRYQFLATLAPDTSQSLGLIERLAFAREALLVWWNHPTLGIGFLRFDEFVDPAHVYFGMSRIRDLGSVHNEFVTTLLKSGWVGAVALFVFLASAFRIFRRASRQFDSDTRQWGIVGIGIGAVLLVSGFALESLRTVAVSAIFWALVGALDGVHQRMYSIMVARSTTSATT